MRWSIPVRPTRKPKDADVAPAKPAATVSTTTVVKKTPGVKKPPAAKKPRKPKKEK